MNHEEHDELWELLGKAQEPKASPFFANKVMHAIRKPEEPTGFWVWLRRRWIIPVTAGACAAIIALSSINTGSKPEAPGHPSSAPSMANARAAQDPLAEMVNVISESGELDTTLTDLLATEDNTVWLAADPSSLF
jgi:hypothetical protein